MNAMTDDDGAVVKGMTWIGSTRFDTTGFLGASREDGALIARGFPGWATLPGPNWLAMARQWHFAFAWLLVINGVAFFLYGFLSRHFTRDLAPTVRDLKHLPREIADHARLKFAHGEKARHYNGASETGLLLCAVRAGAADRADRPDHVAHHGRRLSHPAGDFRRPADRRAPFISSALFPSWDFSSSISSW